MRETATKNRKSRLEYLLSIVGMRMIDGEIAETPEKEISHGRYDRRAVKDIMQDIHKDNHNRI